MNMSDMNPELLSLSYVAETPSTHGDHVPDMRFGQTVYIQVPGMQRALPIMQDVTSGCGGIAWPSGLGLVEYLIRSHRESRVLADKVIVELGAGTGLGPC